ncbi:ATP-binding protein, partial [bacterium]|nr:ATP-binding protein [bacterium]
RLSAMLRMSLERASRQKVPLSEELEFVNLYVDIMKARFGEKLDVRLPLDSSLADALVPNFLLQPLVENAIKHNDLEKSVMARVEVSLKQLQNRLEISIADNGPGISTTENTISGKGVGLSNTRSRLQQLYGSNHLFEIKNRTEGGMMVQIILPLEFSDESMPEKTTV